MLTVSRAWTRVALAVSTALVVAIAAPASGGAAVQFAPPVSYPAGLDAWSIASGDFNRNGRADLAVGDFGGSAVSVLPGTGGGAFGPLQSLPAGGNPETIAVGRLDAGKDLDIAAGTNDSASLLFGGMGTSFSPMQPFGSYLGNQARGTVIADFNRDGKRDVLVSEDEKRLVYLRGKGNRAFRHQQAYKFAPKRAGPLVAGRINGDSRPDLAMASNGAKSIVVFIARKGKRVFRPAATYPGPLQTSGVALGDLNGDGRTDIVDAGGGAGKGGPPNPELDVLLARKGGGFRPPRVKVLPGNYSTGLALADLNGDGTPDAIVVRANGKIVILEGRAAGHFGPPKSVTIGTEAREAVVARLNADTLPDIAVTQGSLDTVAILLAQP